MDLIENFVVAHSDLQAEQDALREWELALTLNHTSEMCCYAINVYNGVPIVPLALSSKESRSMISKLMDSAQDKVYALHRMIVVLYAPTVLKGTQGSMSIKLINQDTSETITVVVEHPVAQAAAFVCRWPRSVRAQSQGLALLVAVEGVNTKRGSLVGVLTPYWEDKMSQKMVYEQTLPSLTYPLEEQAPSFYITDMSKLRSLMASKVHLGGNGFDTSERPIQLTLPKPAGTSLALPQEPVFDESVNSVDGVRLAAQPTIMPTVGGSAPQQQARRPTRNGYVVVNGNTRPPVSG